MDDIRQYILSVTAAAMIAALITAFIGKEGTQATLIRLLCGLFLAVTVISPLAKIQFTNITGFWKDIQSNASSAVAEGQEIALHESSAIIKSNLETYILDKASSMELSLVVEVTLTDSNPPVPYSVSITGSASPYAKKVFQQFIADNIGISKENQIWT